MNNCTRWLLSSVCLAISVTAMADSCYDLYSLPEAKFMAVATTNPTGITSTLNACVTQQACSTSNNPALCMQNLYYYDAMATYYAYAGSASAHASTTPVATTAPSAATPPTPAPSMPAPPSASTANQPMIIVPNPAADNSPNDSSSDSSNNNIYQNIKF